MSKRMKPEASNLLPEPIVLTPEELRQIAATTAGGLSASALAIIIRAGGIPPEPYPNMASVAGPVLVQ